MITISFTGQNDSKIKELSQICLQSPSTITPRIQEIHILFGHIICQLVEENFPKCLILYFLIVMELLMKN